jgi:hypothetical protein
MYSLRFKTSIGIHQRDFDDIKTLTQYKRRHAITESLSLINGEPFVTIDTKVLTLKTAELKVQGLHDLVKKFSGVRFHHK